MNESFAKLFTGILGVVLVVVGLLGFVSALAPGGDLLGIFAIDPVHNVIHLVSGIAAILSVSLAGGRYARWFLGIFGVIYGLVTVIGFVQQTTVLGLISVNLADNLLHTLIAGASLVVFFITARSTSAVEAPRVRARA